MGDIGILNVGAGDTKISFDRNNPEDCARAARTVADMIRRGYVILIEAGHDDKGETLYRRVKEFREDTCEYIIAGDTDVGARNEERHEQSGGAAAPREGSAQTGETRRQTRGARTSGTRSIHASAVSGIAVGRTAGG
jgi:hypothetical protein